MAPGPVQTLSAMTSFRGRSLKLLMFVGTVVSWSLLAATFGARTMTSQMQAQLDEARRGVAELREAMQRQKGGAAAASPDVASGAEAGAAEPAAASAGLRVVAAQEVRRLAFTSLADPYSVTMGSGCVVIEDYDVTLYLDSTQCNSNRCPPCFVFNGSDTSYASTSVLTLTLWRCSAMMLTNDVSLGSGRFRGAAQRIDFINFVDQPAVISDGITKYVMPPRSSAFGTCSATGNDRILMTGTGSFEAQKSAVARLSAAGAVWISLYTYPSWSPRAYFGAYEAPTGKIWVDKGLSDSGGFDTQLDDRNYYDASSQYWYSLYVQSPERRYNHKIVALADGTLLLFGGLSADRTPVFCQDLMSSTDGETWTTETTSTGITNRQRYQVAVHGLNVYVVADRAMVGTQAMAVLQDVWEGSPPWYNSWNQKTQNAAFGRRELHSVVARSDGALLVMGGINFTDGYRMSDVWCSTDQGSYWHLINPSASWDPRADFGAVVRGDGHILIVSGDDDYGGGYTDVWQSADGGNYWSILCPSTPFSARKGFALLARRDGSMLLIGGYAYDSAVQSWTTTTDIYQSGEPGWAG